MRAGQLRHRLSIQSATQTRDTHHGFKQNWTELDKRWGRVEPISSKELFSADKVKGQITHRITLRHFKGLNPSMRIVFKERIFNIARGPINLEERNIEDEVLCIEEIEEQ